MTTLETYLTIMVTVLVATQIVRITQNAVQLRRQNKLIQAQIGQLSDVTNEDFDMQRKAYRLAVEFFLDKKRDKIAQTNR